MSGGKNDETVKVVVRIRPMSSEEERNGNMVCAQAFEQQCMLTLKNPKESDNDAPKQFTFDHVFGADVTQKHIYDLCAFSMVDSVLNGYNGTFFAYGQTGSGKTHTMEGRPDPPVLRGIIPNSFQHIFEHVGNAKDVQFLVRASYLEIYNEEIRDLLSKDPKNGLEIKENVDTGVYVKDLTSVPVKNVTEIDHVMQMGKKNRSVGATLMNQTSSRSHSIFTIVIECCEGDKIRMGKLNLVDLAGSERQSKTGATGDRLKEATKINFSLTALGNVINALVDGKSTHVPYRDSKLTRLLQNSLGGNAKTVMCANCGPADYNYDETLSTLRYANRAKNIKNKPKINEDPKDAMLREYQDEIARLKKQLESRNAGIIIDENGREVKVRNARKEIIEKIIEREVVKEVKVGVSETERLEIQRRAEEEKQYLMKQAQEDMKQLIDAQSRTATEKAELEALVKREAEDKRRLQQQQEELAQKLKDMQEKLIRGGEVLSKVSSNEIQLKRAETEIRERAELQAKLARELATKEETNLQLEEHFNSLQEEVEVKTKKLKKLWTKYQAAEKETKDIQEEFQTERADMLDTIRQLTRAIKLKEIIISNFVPAEFAQNIEKRAQWRDEEDIWTVPKQPETALSSQARSMVGRPISSPMLRRPESSDIRQRKQYDTNIRYKFENIVAMELDMPEKTTQEYEGPKMASRVDNVLSIQMNADDGEDIVATDDNAIANPNLANVSDNGGGAADGGDAGKGEKKKSSKSKSKSSLSAKEEEIDSSSAIVDSGVGSSRSKGTVRRSKDEK